MMLFKPTWHPVNASDSFILYNSVNKTNSIYYDAYTRNEIKLPTTFYYEPKSFNSFNIKEIVFSESTQLSGVNWVIDPSNRNKGKITVRRLIPNVGALAPTMDIYCGGVIKTKVNLSYSWAMNSRPNIGDATFEIFKNPEILLRGNNYFPNDSGTDDYIYLSYNGGNASFSPSVLKDSTDPYHEYELTYDGDYISISGNWSNSDNYTTYDNAKENLSFRIPKSSDIKGSEADNDGPTIVLNWNVVIGWTRREIGCNYTCDPHETPCSHTEPDPDCPTKCIDQCEPLCYAPSCTGDCPMDCPTNTCPPHRCPYGG